MKLNIKTKLAGFAVVLAFLAPSLTFAQETKTYTVKPGDTLSEIAETYNTTVEKLAKLNNIKNVDLIFIDQVLVIDGAAPVAETTTTEAPVAEVEETPAVAETVVEETTYEETYEAPASAPAAAESYSAPAPAPAATVSGSEAEAKEWIAQKESGGSYTATNGRYIGRYQLTDSYLNGDYSAENQERVADAYVAGRYGSWTAAKNFWLNNGWY
ncbi:LysM peptidoglycan-binding domain-containing protein [Streptococcus infantis]|uniref:aggregation-promoting factor n=1 Tax=Streptococcus infantis TaxID=68892 RepID=UPI001CBDDDD6|nr:LysM peptidoglycan-binding domain-containing protein [Streptococcus infantis]MBZ2120540.1 LysM peptidoglycan-binding domain-containing protein [Streptococcus infantis]MBZ2122359.1 LysM peptidoglycan-binding domain-containing protein [Streptococcus infantis]MBZ2126161.1 LysM peptidoglycan-binding domain-containing protein [Streptococcus infantis]